MSSILKALKKLENGDFQQTRGPETKSAENSQDFTPPLPRKTDIKKTIRQQTRERQILNRLAAAAVLLIVSGGLLLFLSHKQRFFSDAVHSKDNAAAPVAKTVASDFQHAAVSEKAIAPVQKKAAVRKENESANPSSEKPVMQVSEVKTGPQESVTVSEKTAVKKIRDPEKADKSPQSLGAKVKAEVEKPVRLPEKIAPVSVPSVARTREPERLPRIQVPEKQTHPSESSSKKSREPEKTEKSLPSPEATVKPEVEKPVRLPEKTASVSGAALSKISEPKKNENISPRAQISAEPKRAKELDDPRLKLQALVWSGDPEKRLAVVNDRIVKTGGFVTDTITVTYIGSDYIAVREGNKEWEVKFKIK